MRDFMTEQLVKRKTTGKDIFIKASLITLTVLSGLLMLQSMIATIVFMILVFVDMYLLKRLDVEYEYTYFDGNLDVAKIMKKQLRKELFSTDIKEDMEIIAPTGSPAVEQYKVDKVLDYSTLYKENKTYTMVTLHKGQKVKMIFEPNEKMLNSMRDVVPRKVIF